MSTNDKKDEKKRSGGNIAMITISSIALVGLTAFGVREYLKSKKGKGAGAESVRGSMRPRPEYMPSASGPSYEQIPTKFGFGY
jgi:hypothetical protein